MNIPILYLILLAFSTIPLTAKSQMTEVANSPEAIAWADSVYNSLTPRQRVAQLFVANIQCTDGEATKAQIRRQIGDNGAGGLLFNKGSLAQYQEMIKYAQSQAKVPLLMTIDGEWGLAMRIPDSPRFPRNMALGAIQDADLLYLYGQETARQCRELGIQMNFAPVMDVNSNPANPVIGTRSFGSDQRRVAQLGAAYAAGMENGGVLSSAKHFPGHGDTDVDSHKALPVINRSVEQMQQVELFPFRKYVESGGSCVMVGHICVPSLDPTMSPASMSPDIVRKNLKQDLNFKGLVVTDGLGMAGANFSENTAVGALKAGADLLLCPRNFLSDLDAVMKAIDNGQIDPDEVEASVRKVLAYKYAVHVAPDALNSDPSLSLKQRLFANKHIIQQLSDAAVTVVKNNDCVLPLGDLGRNKIAIVNIGAPKGENEFDDWVNKYAEADVYAAGTLTAEKMRTYDTVIAAVFDTGESARTALRSLTSARNLVAVFFTNPYKVSKFAASLSHAKAIMLAYEDIPELQAAAAKALFGGIKVNGICPVEIEGVTVAGDGFTLPKTRLGYSSLGASGFDPAVETRIDSAINAAITDGAFPGCQMLVTHKGDVVFDRCYGRMTKGGSPVTPNTLYDLASVSKAVGTLPGVMKAYDLGLFDLDAFASQYVPGLRVEGKDSITPRQLLYHETGIQPSLNLYNIMIDTLSYQGKLLSGRRDKVHTVKIFKDLYGQPGTRMRSDIVSSRPTDEYNVEIAKGIYGGKVTYDSIMERIYASPLRANRNSRYSCLNFSLLMAMEQNITGLPHEQFVADSIWGPLGAYGFCYRPTEKHDASKIAPTENDTYLRKQHLRGYVHDELAAFSGGVQGNAGVFGTATDIAKLCQMWLNGGWYGDARILSNETTELFTTNKSPNSRRGLGFDKPDMENSDKSPCCIEANGSVYGHTGYTGGVFWVDPQNDLVFIFLCNRVDPTRNNPAWSRAAIRPLLMSMLYQAMQ